MGKYIWRFIIFHRFSFEMRLEVLCNHRPPPKNRKVLNPIRHYFFQGYWPTWRIQLYSSFPPHKILKQIFIILSKTLFGIEAMEWKYIWMDYNTALKRANPSPLGIHMSHEKWIVFIYPRKYPSPISLCI